MTPLPPVAGRLLAAWVPAAGIELAAAVADRGAVRGYVRLPYGLAVRAAGCAACTAQIHAAAAVVTGGQPSHTSPDGRWLGFTGGAYGEGLPPAEAALSATMTAANRVADAVAMVAGLGGCWSCSDLAAIL